MSSFLASGIYDASWPPTLPTNHRARTHLSLDKDAPDSRPIAPPGSGRIVSVPEVGGLHHRYVRQAA